MQLGDLLDDCTLNVATSSIEISNVQIDSRRCDEGSLFVALPGATRDGLDYALDAVAHGARCVVASAPANVGVPVVTVPGSQLHALLTHVSASIVGHPETKTRLVGVTGTNGKTSVTTMVAQLARSLSWNAATIGTLTNERTTPAPPELFRTLAQLVENFDPAKRHALVALEVSSHALDQRRVEGLRFQVVAFTNLSHDHLDYHGSMERYFAAKASLFHAEFAQRCVIWVDDEYGARLAAMTELPVTPVSRRDARDVALTLTGTTFFWRDHLVNTSLLGSYNVDNALVAMSIMSALGADDAQVAHAMGDVHPVDGRFDVLRGGTVTVIVDYAHTPEGLRRLLEDVRSLAPTSRVLTVFGCGGDRDRTKRPEMGAVASLFSDVTVVTSDNPRSESPDAIIDDVLEGVLEGRDVRRERDRRRAIQLAIDAALAGDVVVIAGKGHETTQTIGQLSTPFDDRVVAQEFLK
ncbi:MAG: UDP-N-acetylmuramoyl-L-alanyl-D-glutamate--2,6-diaminopimelate ligase [Acidobacteriota bacterium]|nr:UDP-N-acetylmuramoyl-L-alanyl-D-glutamate--2,6-diaminopimelate ligase [Acidobacteriota bacterium]